ncbi:carbamoyltransferase HypF [Neobacillus sp. Marseille-QA0830]
MHTAVKIAVRGRVQGVGFRPFVFQLANTHHLTGTVQNNMDGVKIFAEGKTEELKRFAADLQNKAPRLSKIEEVNVEEADARHSGHFTIIESERSGASRLVIPIDSAVCEDCLREMNDPDDFRYRYPFINCTQCGPRYTIIDELPYDRSYTTMKAFQMCEDCRREYEDPTNRRHHAQPIACPKCGPKVRMVNSEGKEIDSENPIQDTINLIKAGKIIAVKGIGGYHLCCDAHNEQTVSLLRKRKNRPNRPLAVMAASVSKAMEFAKISEDEKSLLESPEAPIVILKKHESYNLADFVAPHMKTIGVMLPYSPLHHLLFWNNDLTCLVMTSANPSGLPILFKDEDVFQYLTGIADSFLVYNREIIHPVDDSVVQINAGKLDFLRRSRGFVPDPFPTEQDVTGIVAFGGQQKTAFTIGKLQQIFVGPHIGDLENMETINHFHQELKHLLKWIDTPISTAVIDAHPDYETRKLVNQYSFNDVMEIQHHHAHMAACLDEHHVTGRAFGIILDGTGYGLDGHVWGFEILYGNAAESKRMAHLHYTPLPGGEKCIREPWRNAASMLLSLRGEEGLQLAKSIFPDKTQEIDLLQMMINRNINTVYAGTCGRLFDAVSAICGITRVSTYDGEAAIQLAELADEGLTYLPYSFRLLDKEVLTIDFSSMLKEIALEVLADTSQEQISGRFHETVVQAIMAALVRLRRDQPNLERIAVLSGGSFHNRYIRKKLTEKLQEQGYQVFVPERVPCSDGGLSYGQLVAAAAKRRSAICV